MELLPSPPPISQTHAGVGGEAGFDYKAQMQAGNRSYRTGLSMGR